MALIETFQNQSTFTNNLTANKLFVTSQLLSANTDVLNIISSSINNSSVYTTTNTNSANWNNTYTTVGSNSARWNSAYTTLNSNSGTWVRTTNPTASGTLTLTNTFVSVSGQLAGTEYSGISAYGSTDRSVVLAAKGTGATVAQLPDGTSAGGNNRGTYATDWQKNRNAASQVASGPYSTIGGGCANTASGYYCGGGSTVGGGQSNTASGPYSTVSGGYNNCAESYKDTVGGGTNNRAFTYSNCYGCGAGSTVGGGSYNTASGYYGGSTVGGGYFNQACGNYSTIGGGRTNTASGNYSTVGGGGTNTASVAYSTVGGGISNTASGTRSTIGGGASNTASGTYSTVGGGSFNQACGDYSTVGGGRTNTASGNYSTVGGGISNIASGNYSGILGGSSNNTNNLNNAFIIGSNITASQADTTFVNNLYSQGVIYAGSVYATGVGLGLRSPISQFYIKDDLYGGQNTAGSIGELGWTTASLSGTGSGTFSVTVASDHIGAYQLTTGTSIGNCQVLYLTNSSVAALNTLNTRVWEMWFRVKIDVVTSVAAYIGLIWDETVVTKIDNAGAGSNNKGYFIAFETGITPADTQWSLKVCSDATGATGKVSTAAFTGSIAANTWYTFKMRNDGSGTIYATMYNAAGAIVGSEISVPSTNTITNAVRPMFEIITRSAASRALTIDYISFAGQITR